MHYDPSHFDQQYMKARDEYAAMLRLEGLKYREIAERFGVCIEQARLYVSGGFRRMRPKLERTMQRTKFTIT